MDRFGIAEGKAPERAIVYGISCLIFSAWDPSRLLLGVRTATPTSPRHPGVLSTPTLRVPSVLFNACGAGDLSAAPDGVIRELRGKPSRLVGAGLSQSPDVFAVETLLARKLGLATVLVTGELRGTAAAVAVAVDSVHDPLGTELTERTALLSYAVQLTAGSEFVPEATASYSRLFWADAGLIREAVRARDALIVDETLNPFEVCIDGLCIKSAAHLSERLASA